MDKKIVAILGLISCISFVFAGVYVYYFKGASLQLLIIDILFFGTGAIVSMISLMSERKSWTIDVKKLSKSQSVLIGVCGVIFSIAFLWIVLVFNIHIALKVILFYGFVAFGVWSIKLLVKRKEIKLCQGLPED